MLSAEHLACTALALARAAHVRSFGTEVPQDDAGLMGIFQLSQYSTAMRIDAHQHFWIYDPREYDWIDDSMAALRAVVGPLMEAGKARRQGAETSVVSD